MEMRFFCSCALLLIAGASRAQLGILSTLGQPLLQQDYERASWIQTFSQTPPAMRAVPGVRMIHSKKTARQYGAEANQVDVSYELTLCNAAGRPDTCLAWSGGSWRPQVPVWMLVNIYNDTGALVEQRSLYRARLRSLLPHPVIDSAETVQYQESVSVPVPPTIPDQSRGGLFTDQRSTGQVYADSKVRFMRSLVTYADGHPAFINKYAITDRDTLLTDSVHFTYSENRLTASFGVMYLPDHATFYKEVATYDTLGRITSFATGRWSESGSTYADAYREEDRSDTLSIVPVVYQGKNRVSVGGGMWLTLDGQGRVIRQRYQEKNPDRGRRKAPKRKTILWIRYDSAGRSITERHRYTDAGRGYRPITTRRHHFDETGRIISYESISGIWWSKQEWRYE